MVAQKRGRGGKGQSPRGRVVAAAPVAEDQSMEQETVAEQPVEAEAGGNGEATLEQQEEANENALLEGADAEQDADMPETEQEQETPAVAKKEEEEDKMESGKLLVENLPTCYLFDYQQKLKELFSKHGDILSIKRGPIIVTELTTTPTLSAIVEFKNKESLTKALVEEGIILEGNKVSVAIESLAETAILVGVPYEATTDYVRLLFTQCGEIQQVQEFSKAKYKILRVTFQDKSGVEKALKLDRELRINGFLVTVSKYRDEEEQKAHSANINKNKRQHPQNQPGRNSNNTNMSSTNNQQNRTNNFRGGRGGNYNTRGNFRDDYTGGRGRGGFSGRGGGGYSHSRGGYAAINTYMPPAAFMGRPGQFMDGQRPNKRLRQM